MWDWIPANLTSLLMFIMTVLYFLQVILFVIVRWIWRHKAYNIFLGYGFILSSLHLLISPPSHICLILFMLKMKVSVISNVTSYWLAVPDWSVVLTKILRLQGKMPWLICNVHCGHQRQRGWPSASNLPVSIWRWVKESMWIASTGLSLLLKHPRSFKGNEC